MPVRLILALAVILFWGAFAEAAQTAVYAIRRNGDKIGEYRFSVSTDGTRRELAAEMSIRVKVLFITVYSATHLREETWIGDTLEESHSTSEYNGKDFVVDLWREGDTYLLRTQKGARYIDAPAITLVPWMPAAADNKAILVTEKGRSYPVVLKAAGTEALESMGTAVEATRYILEGRKTWELWYGPEGDLLRISYEKDGADLDIVLESRQ